MSALTIAAQDSATMLWREMKQVALSTGSARWRSLAVRY